MKSFKKAGKGFVLSAISPLLREAKRHLRLVTGHMVLLKMRRTWKLLRKH